ncbi:Single hybrid motif superfamily protein [Hibiscus syriacus]|uniref:Single hybrid motif superfamily protein n=2 Tax=Hibiscus syriacus TaxID=106335 RepID=A0A6A3BE01_HIBSY|nr:Single hybrid motif superfamily protein [Hibiscus syriacus]
MLSCLGFTRETMRSLSSMRISPMAASVAPITRRKIPNRGGLWKKLLGKKKAKAWRLGQKLGSLTFLPTNEQKLLNSFIPIRSVNYTRMEDIVEETNGKHANMVEITVKTIGPTRPSPLHVPSSIKVIELRKLVARKNHLPEENLKLILQGKVLHDREDEDDVYTRLNDGDSLIVAVKPKAPVGLNIEDDDEDLKFQLPQSTSRWKKKLYSFLRNRLKLPDIILMAMFSLSLKAWALVILWFILAPIAHKWELGPLYILGTGFCLIFLNLGRRQPGDVSAYSIFNEDFRELPGTLNADAIDRDIRTGRI